MKKILILNFVFALFLISCQHDDVSKIISDSAKIPIDSFYLSCRIDGVDYVFESPMFSNQSQKSYAITLNGKNGLKYDSVIAGYSYGYYTDKYLIKIGFSNYFLMDTTASKTGVLKDRIYKAGQNHMSYFPDYATIQSDISKYTGLSIDIYNYQTHKHYTSYYPNWSDYSNVDLYNFYMTNSSMHISKLMALNSGQYSDYQNAWYVESIFSCPVFEYDMLDGSYSTKQLSVGVLRGVF
jgi:hypothetical protein